MDPHPGDLSWSDGKHLTQIAKSKIAWPVDQILNRIAHLYEDSAAPFVSRPYKLGVIGLDAPGMSDFKSAIELCGIAEISLHFLSQGQLSESLIPTDYHLIFVDIDGFKSIDAAIDALFELRAKTPRVQVIIMSREVQRDDFGEERKAICDATIRWPIGPERLSMALQHFLEGRSGH